MPAEPPDLTVIVRTCGRSPMFLRRALDAIRAQTCPPAVVALVNDADHATDVDAEAARLQNPPFHVRRVQRDGSVQPRPNRSAALNRGIAACDTAWLAFLDDDDTWSPRFVERVAPTLAEGARRPDFGGVVVRTEAVYERLKDGRIVEEGREPFNPSLVAIELADLAVENRFTLNAMVIRREVFTAVGGYREDLPVLEDWEFNVRAAARFHFDVVPEALARYHQRPADGPAPNSVPVEMLRTAARIRNEWLRADIAAGRLGLGQLALAGETRGLGGELSRWCRWRSRLAGWLGRKKR